MMPGILALVPSDWFPVKMIQIHQLPSHRHHLHTFKQKQKKKPKSRGFPASVQHRWSTSATQKRSHNIKRNSKECQNVKIHWLTVNLQMEGWMFPLSEWINFVCCFVSPSSSSLRCAFLSSIHLPHSGSIRGLVFTVHSELITISGLHTHSMYSEWNTLRCRVRYSPQSFHSCSKNWDAGAEKNAIVSPWIFLCSTLCSVVNI